MKKDTFMITRSGNRARQTGATLLTSVIMLVVMTVLGVSAAKISSIDTLIAGNEQQQMIVYQETASKLTALAKVSGLYKAFDESNVFTGNVDGNTNRFKMSDSTDGATEFVTDLRRRVECNRGGNGTSIGALDCKIYDFEVRMKKTNSSANDEHHRGVGKAAPKISSKGSIL